MLIIDVVGLLGSHTVAHTNTFFVCDVHNICFLIYYGLIWFMISKIKK